MIKIEGIRKRFEGKEVLKGIDATFNAGECSLIIGKSGAGKTVLLKCLVGLEKPSSGVVLYEGKDLNRLSSKQMTKLRIEAGMLFQGSALFDSMTILENVLFPLEMFSPLSRNKIRTRALECIERVQLTDAQRKYPNEISGGMMKRAAIARAIALEPKYLFCDEPTSGLDPMTSQVIDSLLQEITRENNITTIINTHDMNSVLSIGDKVLFLHNGTLEWEGKGSEIQRCDNEKVKHFISTEYSKESS